MPGKHSTLLFAAATAEVAHETHKDTDNLVTVNP
jgi:hypothetical protein